MQVKLLLLPKLLSVFCLSARKVVLVMTQTPVVVRSNLEHFLVVGSDAYLTHFEMLDDMIPRSHRAKLQPTTEVVVDGIFIIAPSEGILEHPRG